MPDILDRPLNGWWRDTQPLAALVASAGPGGGGPGFVMPLIISENVRTEDGRLFPNLTARNVPLPVLATWTTDGVPHGGAVVVGRLNTIQRDAQGNWSGTGVFDTSPEAVEAARLVAEGFLNSVSMDATGSEFIERTTIQDLGADVFGEDFDPSAPFTMETYVKSEMDFPNAVICGVTIVPMPGLKDARIVLDDAAPMSLAASSEPIPEMRATPIRAAVVVEAPPAEWFADPQFNDATTVPLEGFPGKRGCPLAVEDDGRVYGHLACWGVPHRGAQGQTIYAPRSMQNYGQFRLGYVVTEGGKIATGPLVADTGHADLSLSASATVSHYDNTGTAWADVTCGEDDYGIWVAGRVRPGVSADKVYAVRASGGLSGDWRPISGQLELVAALTVNTAGFPVSRYALAASAGSWNGGFREKDGEIMALVAAGSGPLLLAKQPVTRGELDAVLARVRKIEAAAVARQFDRDELRARRTARVQQAKEKLTAR